MKVFKDKESREWEINLTIGAVKRVRDLVGVNLFELEEGDPPLLTRLSIDEILICDILYCLCKLQADRRGISDEQFGELLTGDVIMAGMDAFYAEMVDFFRVRGRMDRVKALQVQLKTVQMAVERVGKEIDGLQIEKQIEDAFGNVSFDSPEPSGLTPPH